MNRMTSLKLVMMLTAFILLTGCSGELSRGKAEHMINDFLINDIITHQIYLGQRDFKKEDVPKFRQLANKGFIDMRFIASDNYYERYEISMPAQATPYILKYEKDSVTVKLADKIEPKVTGITKSSNDAAGNIVCIAIYLYKLKPTPFGEAFISQNDLTSYHNANKQFMLFDDGWRRTK